MTWEEVFAPFEPLLTLLDMDWTQEAIEDSMASVEKNAEIAVGN